MVISPRILSLLELAVAALACGACGRSMLEDAATFEACTPGSTTACYSGPSATRDVGNCTPGFAVCLLDGSGYGPCAGEVLPSPEVCGTAVDESCDGLVDEGCACVPGSFAACYDGPGGTLEVGVCRAGTQECLSDGASHGPCVGGVLPSLEVCGTAVDESCDGLVDEGCVCVPGSSVACYEGPAETQDIGPCKAGTQECLPSGSGYGPCSGQVLPAKLLCDLATDDTCNGDVDLCTPCVPGTLDPGCQPDGCFAGLSPTWNVEVGPPPRGFYGYQPNWLSGDAGGNVYFANTTLGDMPGGCIVYENRIHTIHRYGADASEWERETSWTDVFPGCAGGGYGNFSGVESGLSANGQLAIYSFAEDYDESNANSTWYIHWTSTLSSIDALGTETWKTVFPEGVEDCTWWPECSYANAIDVIARVAIDSTGNVALAGQFSGGLDLGGGPVAAGYGSFVAKFDSTGLFLWGIGLYVDRSYYASPDVLMDSAGNIYVAAPVGGDSTGACGLSLGIDPMTEDTAVFALSPNGDCLWSQRVAARFTGGERFAVDAFGRVALAGRTAGGSDVVTKLGLNGAPLWTTPLPASPANVRFDASGNVVVVGTFKDTIDFGQGKIASVGDKDVWVARYDSSGSLQCGTRWGTPGPDTAGISFDPLGNTLVWFSPKSDSVSLFKYPPWL